ncbi:DUF2202 domain-containing protein [Hujiaoplasma nucleasis]|uniref:DUF2202 domain-containing protein n=1 Tax=Hujiaoplasma nucleasis TaxID=2725268 RepID=A0A7L6N2L4_9MOLU|nr:DUF2202 domain-containing protein [Hujiaoplasma nucleasis]QLY40500.1 DUF2202 domain-containing protein [Hujiaoplasma nucleasis]
MKSKLAKGIIFTVLTLVFALTISLSSVSAGSVYSGIDRQKEFAFSEDIEYSLEEMLNFAIQDEYLAKSEYEAIINEFGEVRPFINIVEAEQQHINLLLPLFEKYGIEVPEDNSAEKVVIPESITSAIATGIEAEKVNIAMYELFLSQDNLDQDVRDVFEYLLQASENHLSAFSKDRNQYYGQDMMNQFRNKINNMFQKEGNDSSRGSRQQAHGGNCTN